MKTGGGSNGGPVARGGRGESRAVAATTAAILLVALLVIFVGGCGGSSLDDPTPDLSTASTGEVPSVTTTVDSTADGGKTGAGTRRDPISLGREAPVGDWRIRVVGADLDATQVVLDENMFNDAPKEGSQYVLVSVEVTYVGHESSTFWIDTLYTFVGDEGDTFDVAAAVAPDSITDTGEVTNGESVSGNLVFVVDSKQISGGTVMFEEAFAWDLSRIFFAVE